MRRPLRSVFVTIVHGGREGLWTPAAVKDLFPEWNIKGWNKSLNADATALPPTALPSFCYNRTNRTNTKLKRTASKVFLLVGGAS
ncbi:hypothetical protein J2Z66_005680 [Paenibacillus eucommiae]|uniref:Uncharacterized protein n=1 Tax=Paenibacillus eucommiae TaxID=1355755 RepID=A0ABS4J2J0_9BACL|nr:hypothetical protein [Paenibacillus eucommiae]